ncbi:protein binding protein, putative [Ricinus communis]|uniref:Protein binding protein, putative n=1 Tax=Ricinus communis TaxID=3988 RepID=B9RDX8_RICCO|nr:protein binding protein, putative [Ricinus communis]
MVINANSFAKTICSICYDDLKPIVEDLQAISICGHVFHELCLQQWFEYCSNSKKCSCPVCKQSCTGSNVARLYFQSLGDQNESVLSQKVIECKEDPELLRGEVKRLEVKVTGLTSNLERQDKEINQLNEELDLSKGQLKKEVALKNDVMGQKSAIQQLLLLKSEELDNVKLECLKLQDRNMALAKELAALKLVSDLNLEEDEILKFASFGNEASNTDTIDVLRKSLVVRNKSYKELMSKCNQLGRGEARYCKKLEKAKEKISKLKTRIQELEMTVEVKDNEALKALKASKKVHCKEVTLNGANDNSSALLSSLFASENKKEKHFKSASISDQTGNFNSDQGNLNIISGILADSIKECASIMALNKEIGGKLYTRPCTGTDKGNMSAASTEDEVMLVNDVRYVRPMLNIRKESPSVSVSKPGDICFSSGLLGPDGTNRYLGKWCKRSRNKEPSALHSASTSSGDLIAVGSDGRGGRIKVLRSLNESPLDAKESSVAAKRCKYGAKASNLQSQGCLQIEHFFGRATQ